MDTIRISKLMSERGLCSRREADAFIERGWVRVDGQVAVLGQKARPNAKIVLDKVAEKRQTERVTIILHKPVGYVSGQAEKGYRNAASLIQASTQHRPGQSGQARFNPAHLRGLAPAGRLDIDSQGLLVLTQDGRIARQLIGEDSDLDKEYLVRVTGNVDERGLAMLRHGLSLDGKALLPAKVRRQNDDQLHFVLREEKNVKFVVCVKPWA